MELTSTHSTVWGPNTLLRQPVSLGKTTTVAFLLLGVLLCMLVPVVQVVAQSPNRFSSGMFVTPNNWAQNASTFMTSGPGSSWIHTTKANGTGDRYFRFYSASSGGTTYEPTGSSDILITPSTPTSLQVSSGSGKAYYINAPNTTDDWVFKTAGNGAPGTSRFIVFNMQGNVANVPSAGSVTRSPSTVNRAQDAVISAAASAVLPAGQGLYLRYSTDNFVTSTVVSMAFNTGTTYTATIPGSVNTAGTIVRYYVFTSGSGLTISHADADFYTINLQNNSGSNYSYTVTDRYVTANSGNWSNTSTWTGGVVPPTNSNVTLNHNITLNSSFVQMNSLTFASGVTLDLGANSMDLNSTGAVTVISGSSGASITTTTGSLSILGSGTKTISGTIKLGNVVFRTTISLGTGVTIENGTMTLTSGGSITNNAPTYGTGSTLRYATGGTRDRSTEWTSFGSGRGIPLHVTVTSNTSLNMVPDSYYELTGNLTIDAGSSMSTNTVSTLDIGGDFIHNGHFVGSNFTGAGIRLSGNLICGATSTVTVGSGGGGIDFNGPGPQTISGTVPDFGSLEMNSSATSLTLLSPVTVSLNFQQRAGTLTNAHRLTLASGASLIVNAAGFMDASPTYVGNNRISLQSGYNGTMGFDLPSDDKWTTISTGGTVILPRSLVVGASSNISVVSSSTLNIQGFTISGSGSMSMGGTVAFSNSGGISAAVPITNLTTNTVSSFLFNSSGVLGPRAGCDNASIRLADGVSVDHNSADFICRNLVLGAGSSWTANNRLLTINSNTSQNGITLGAGATFNAGTGTLAFQGNGTHTIVGLINPYNVSIQTGRLVFASGETIQNSLRILQGGALQTTSPIYASGSTLIYNTTSTYNRSIEWNSNSGAGYPHHVQVSTGTLNVPGSTPGTARSIAGTFTVLNGATASFGTMSVRFTASRLDIQGALNMSTIVGGDIAFTEAFEFNTGATLTANTREIVGIGSGAKTIGGTAAPIPNLDLVAIEEGSLSFSAPVTIVNRLRFVPGTTTNTTNLTMADGATLLRTGGTLTATPALAGNINILYQHSGTLSPDAEVPADQTKINSLTMGGSGTLTLNQNFTIRSGAFFVLNSGTLAPGAFSISGAGTYSHTNGTLSITGAGGLAAALPVSNRTWTAGTINFSGGAAMNFGVIPGLNNMPVTITGPGTAVTQEGNVTVRDLNVGTGSTYLLGTSTLTFARTSGSVLDIAGTFTPGTGKVVFASSGGNVQSITGTATLYDVDITPSGIAGVNFNGITIAGTLTMNPGSFVTTAGPVYASGSTLRYNNGSTYNISVEWTTPHHVFVTNNTLLNIGGAIPAVSRFMNGDLIIQSGSAASTNESGSKMTRAFNVGGSIICNGGLYLSDQFGGDLNLGGDLLLNTGTLFVPNTRAITFNGAADQTIGGTMSGTTEVQFISVNKPSGTVIIDRDLNFNNGSGLVRFWLEAGTVNFNGKSITATGTGTKTFRMDAGTLVTGGTPLTGHGWSFTDGVTPNALGGTVNFNRTGTEDIPALTYGGVILSGSDDKTLLGSLTIRNQLTLAGGAELSAGANTIAYNAGATLAYQGNSVQYIGAEWPTVDAPTNLEFASDLWVEVTASRTVPGTLTFTKGDVVVGANVLTLGTGPSATGTLVNNSTGSIIGNFRRWIPASSGTYNFPVGLPSTQRLASIDFTSAPSAGTLTCTYVPGTTTTAGLPLMDGGQRINNLGANGYWRINTGDGLNGGTYTITLRGNTLLGVNDYTRLRVVKRANLAANWEALGTGVAPTGSNADFSIGRGGLSTFSEFAIAGDFAENPLPVVLVRFSAEREVLIDRLEWSTASEQNAAYFLLSTGTDGRRFNPIARIKAAGTTSASTSYAHEVKLDGKSADMPKYYRLQQYDLDGTLAGTWFAHTGTGALATTWALYPNPIQDKAVVQLPLAADLVTLQLTTAQGKVVWTAEGTPLELAAQAEQKLTMLSAGMYQLSGSYTGTRTGFGLLPALKVVKQ